MNVALVVCAMILASVVFPTPGGPHKIIEVVSSVSNCSRSALPGPSKCSWPTNSSRVRGRMRSASGRWRKSEGVSLEYAGSPGSASNRLMACFRGMRSCVAAMPHTAQWRRRWRRSTIPHDLGMAHGELPSQKDRISSEIPAPSLPMTNAMGPRKSASKMETPASATQAYIGICFRRDVAVARYLPTKQPEAESLIPQRLAALSGSKGWHFLASAELHWRRRPRRIE